MIATTILAKVDTDRLQCGCEGLASGAYSIQITRQNEREISTYVANGDNRTYSVTLTDGRSFCGCGDSMFRGKCCKHQVALALFAIRTPKAAQHPERKEEASTDYMIHMLGHSEDRPGNLKLAKVRRVA